MLPKSSIHINPKFCNVHINPNFINKLNREQGNVLQSSQSSSSPTSQPSTNIYINPRFLTDSQIISTTVVLNSTTTTSTSIPSIHINPEPLAIIPDQGQQIQTTGDKTAKIITKTNRKLIRQPVAISKSNATTILSKKTCVNKTPLVKIGSRKLIRAPTMTTTPSCRTQTIANAPPQAKAISKAVQTKYKIVKARSTYKIDRRTLKAKVSSPVKKNNKISGKTWINKATGLNECLSPTKVIVTNYKLRRM